MYYMLSKWWLHLLAGLGHYVIYTGAIEQVLVIKTNIIKLGYNYDLFRLKSLTKSFHSLTQIVQLVTCNFSRLFQSLAC